MNGNESAFPIVMVRHNLNGEARHFLDENGLTKREYFAGLAMQGILAYGHDADSNMDPAFTARDAVGFADALLAELEKSK